MRYNRQTETEKERKRKTENQRKICGRQRERQTDARPQGGCLRESHRGKEQEEEKSPAVPASQ